MTQFSLTSLVNDVYVHLIEPHVYKPKKMEPTEKSAINDGTGRIGKWFEI